MSESKANPRQFDLGVEHQSFNRTRWSGLFIFLSSFTVAFIIYTLSFGPVLRLCGVHPGGGWSSLPPAVRFIYAPLGGIGAYLPRAYEHYIFWCIAPSA